MDPTALAFQSLGPTVESVDVTDVGTGPITVEPPTLAGPDAAHFAVAGQACVAAVRPGSSCRLRVTFKQSPGTFDAVLIVRVAGAAATEVPITASAIL